MDYIIKNNLTGAVSKYSSLKAFSEGLEEVAKFTHWNREAQEAFMKRIRSGKTPKIGIAGISVTVGLKKSFSKSDLGK